MEENKKEEVLPEGKVKKVHKFRDTALIRVERSIKDTIKEISKERGWSMTWINDHALLDFIESVKPLD
jgi:predicted dithiol-disulfide oxidoreductase (DUF899 family)